jgi:Ca-activated chloride channel family protein
MKRVAIPVLLLSLAALLIGRLPFTNSEGRADAPPGPQQQAADQNAAGGPNGKAGGRAMRVAAPVAFASKDGRIKGWKVVIPGKRALATPAVVGGKVFIGGGFGSHEFYAFDARTGKKVWQYQTKDDGPTAAVVSGDYVVFNTESCELEVLTVSGKPVWKKWLGDPLMSMPAIADGKIYMAFPNSKGDRKHYLTCIDLKSGKESWKKPIAGEIITAPVVKGSQVYLATLEGTLYCFAQKDGALVWKEKKNATSAPVVWNNNCYFSRREATTLAKGGKKVKQQTEQVATRGTGRRHSIKDLKATARKADYLDYSKRRTSDKESASQKGDADVGFGGAKGDAKIDQGVANLGQASVHGIWSYQGSKPFVYKNQLYSAMGDDLLCVDPKTEKVVWKKNLAKVGKKGKGKGPLLDSVLTPPALVNEKIFVGTDHGDVICLSAKSGQELWRANVGESIVFQPAVVKGRVYVSTSAGSLFCLETGEAKDDGWLMWGGNSAHNGLVK